MMKGLAIIGLLVAAGLAISVYRAKLGASETEARISTLETEIRAVTDDISVLKAEEAYLSRPERIGPLARRHLGLEPASPDQFTASEALARRLGQERLTLPQQDEAVSIPEAPDAR